MIAHPLSSQTKVRALAQELLKVRRAQLVALAVILSAALTLRMVGIKWGLPYVFYPDEALIVNHAAAFGTGDLNPHFFVYPSLYMYVLSVIYGATYVVGWLMGVFTSTDDFVRLFFNDATAFYLPGRVIAALSGVVTVGCLYVYGRRAYETSAGLIAAAFLAFSAMHVEFSHYVKTHVPAGLFVMLSLLSAWRIYESRDRGRHYLLAGLFAGLAASTVYHAGFVVVAMFTAHVLHWATFSRKQLSSERLFSGRLLGGLAACISGFLITTPYSLLDWRTFIGDLTSTANTYYHGSMWVRDTFFPFLSLTKSMGAPLGYMALFGIGYGLLRRRPSDYILLSFILVLGGFLMMFASKEAHHMLIAFGPMFLLSGSLLVDIAGWSIRQPTFRSAALLVAAALLIAGSAKRSFERSYSMTMKDTRVEAKDWVEANIPHGSKVLMDSGKYYLESFGPPLRLSRWTLQQFVSRGESLDVRSLASRDGTRRTGYSGEAAFFGHELRTLDDDRGYDVIQILHDLGSPKADVLSCDDYLAMGVRYVITSSYARNTYAPGTEVETLYPEKTARYRSFYQTLDERGVIMKEFGPSRGNGGPVIRIYKIH